MNVLLIDLNQKIEWSLKVKKDWQTDSFAAYYATILYKNEQFLNTITHFEIQLVSNQTSVYEGDIDINTGTVQLPQSN